MNKPVHARNFEKYYAMNSYDELALNQANIIFNDYLSKNIILNDSFYENEWKITNQVKTSQINFGFNELLFYKNTYTWMGCSCSEFSNYAKIYITFLLGKLGVFTLKEIVAELHILIQKSYEELVCGEIFFSEHVRDILRQIPSSNKVHDTVLEALDETANQTKWKRNQRKKRLLADFSAYFNFNDALQKFWEHAGSQEKIYFFPLRLWWTLTSILPLRPTEFLLIPYECLETNNGKYVLSVRRTAQKKGNKKVTYCIDKDYVKAKYIIPDKMAEEIFEYKSSTKNMLSSELDTLFAPLTQNTKRLEMKKYKYYTYSNLINCLKRFQYEIMALPKDSENLINLGDTRHIAMIGLIISGGSPTICKELAGHNNINISSHYYSNISKFIECATYEAYRKSLTNTATIRKHRPKTPKLNTVEVGEGHCDSPKYKKGSIDDCIKHMDSNGEIGNCIECPYFIDEKYGMYIAFADPKKRKKQVDDDSRALIEAIDSVRKGIGAKEDIQSALLRLQHSSTWYSKFLQKDLEVNNYGKTT